MTAQKDSKNEQTNGSNPAEAATSEPATTEETPQPKKHARTMNNPSRKTAASKTTGGKGAAKKRAAKARTRAPRPYEPSDADVRLRAYFIAERRVQLALQGDPGRDWIEARQQLLAEAQAARQ